MLRTVEAKRSTPVWLFLGIVAAASVPLLSVGWFLSFSERDTRTQVAFAKDASQQWHNIPLRIRDKSRTNGKDMQQSFEQYAITVLTISLNAPTNVLIFGCGLDSYMYFLANRGPDSNTVFLENIPEWLQIVRNDLQQNAQLNDDQRASVTLASVNYTTDSTLSFQMTRDRKLAFLKKMEEVQFANELQSLAYSVVIVDGPQGHAAGRSQAVFVAWNQTQHSLRSGVPLVHVFVHDTNRKEEAHFADVFFGDDFVDFNRAYDDEIYHSPDRGFVAPNSMRYYRCDAHWAQVHSYDALVRHFYVRNAATQPTMQ